MEVGAMRIAVAVPLPPPLGHPPPGGGDMAYGSREILEMEGEWWYNGRKYVLVEGFL